MMYYDQTIIDVPLSYLTAPGRPAKRNLSLHKFYHHIMNYFNIYDETLIKSPSRERELVTARHIFCWFAWHYTDCTLNKIGQFINRDHSTVTVSIQRINDYTETNDPINNDIEMITKDINISKHDLRR